MKARFGEAWERLFAPAVAHRGLWSKAGPPENSLGAFELACEAGYGIELDVQLSSDGEAMVFHDLRLTRMTGEEGRICDHTAADLVDAAVKAYLRAQCGHAAKPSKIRLSQCALTLSHSDGLRTVQATTGIPCLRSVSARSLGSMSSPSARKCGRAIATCSSRA